ncbi:PAS domain S-box-containing protein [Herbaspirillum rubrisubalbicans]|uniref:sensor domain-containing phosphodiesterase n=1 Tax=Herbaspirillum rubrisubalbicans TaxID=80842 RepID=UPI0020A05ABA|nr:PAS domain S-box-containing protein [Herbaspirillum rubrisubalbicans]
MRAPIAADDIRTALDAGHLWPALQPLVHLRTGRIAGFEMLARWNCPQRGVISPVDFITVAEDAGLLDTLLLKLLDTVADSLRHWPADLRLAINLSPRQFLDTSLLERLSTVMHAHGLPLSRLQLEITESSLVQDHERTLQTIQAARQAGASLSLDDFGTGYSSLTRLQSYPFDEIKIDASFVRTMDQDPDSFRIVLAVAGLGQSLKMHVVAEGVETSHHAHLLKRMGCEFGQGFHLGRPAPLAEAARLIEQQGVWQRHSAGIDTSPFQRWHQLDSLYRSAPVGLCFLDPLLRVVSANAMMIDLLGGNADSELEGSPVIRLLDRSEHRPLLQMLAQVVDGASAAPMEFFNSRTGRTSLLAFQLVRSDLGELLGISGSAVDITARVAAERTVRDSEEHFHRAIDLNPNIPWAADERGVVDYIGPTFEWQPELNNVQRHQQWVARILEDDRQRVRQEWLDNLPSGRPFSTEFRVLWPDGQWRWMRSRASPHADGEGRILRWYGLIVDISVERALQQRIALLEQQLQPVRPSGDA